MSKVTSTTAAKSKNSVPVPPPKIGKTSLKIIPNVANTTQISKAIPYPTVPSIKSPVVNSNNSADPVTPLAPLTNISESSPPVTMIENSNPKSPRTAISLLDDHFKVYDKPERRILLEYDSKRLYGIYQHEDGNLFAYKFFEKDDDYKLNGIPDLIEIDIYNRISHPHILQAAGLITNLNYQIQTLALILPLAERTLWNSHRELTLGTKKKLPILYKIAKALAFLHANNILHLDVKDSNVFLQNIRDNHPLLTNFEYALYVPDIKIGKKESSITRVTIDHRAPEILVEEPIYTAAVDVWSYGIMLLRTIGDYQSFFKIAGEKIDFAKISLSELKKFLEEKIKNANFSNNLFPGIDSNYQKLAIDLLSKILVLEPSKRPTMIEICQHPLFTDFRSEMNEKVRLPPVNTNYIPEHREILKIIIEWLSKEYKTETVELLFLTIDIYNRTASFFRDRPVYMTAIAGAASLYIAAKLLNCMLLPTDIFVNRLVITVQEITVENLLQAELCIIYYLNGVFNVQNVYHICDNGDQLRSCFMEVIMSKDSTFYGKIDLYQWKKDYLTREIPIKIENKDITIEQLFNL